MSLAARLDRAEWEGPPPAPRPPWGYDPDPLNGMLVLGRDGSVRGYWWSAMGPTVGAPGVGVIAARAADLWRRMGGLA